MSNKKIKSGFIDLVDEIYLHKDSEKFVYDGKSFTLPYFYPH